VVYIALMGRLHDPANVQQTSSKCVQNTRANAGRLLDRVNILLIRSPGPPANSIMRLITVWKITEKIIRTASTVAYAQF